MLMLLLLVVWPSFLCLDECSRARRGREQRQGRGKPAPWAEDSRAIRIGQVGMESGGLDVVRQKLTDLRTLLDEGLLEKAEFAASTRGPCSPPFKCPQQRGPCAADGGPAWTAINGLIQLAILRGSQSAACTGSRLCRALVLALVRSRPG